MLDVMVKPDMLAPWTRAQFGLVTADQLRCSGYTRSRIRTLVRIGVLEVVRPRVFRLCGAPPSWRCRALAAVLSSGGDALLSHRSAGVVWGLLDHRSQSAFDITGSRQNRQPGIRGRVRPVPDGERTIRESIPVTSPARTLVDLAEMTTAPALGRLVDEGLRRRILDLGQLHEAARRRTGGRAGARYEVLTKALAERGIGYDPGANDWEREMDAMWERWDLPPAERQYWIEACGHSYRPDRVIVDLRVTVDWNGREFHGTRSGFNRDSDRRNHLQAAGWRAIDFRYGADPNMVVGTVLQVCEQQRRLLRVG